MTTSEQSRADATPYWCSDCEIEISGATRHWHQREGHHTHGPIERDASDSYQSRADAMADAEQLWTLTPGYYDDAFEAARLGDGAVRTIQCMCSLAGVYPHDYARLAARAAFRAVPGLRGDR